MGDISTDIQLNVSFPQTRNHEEKSVSKKSALQRKLKWKKKREERIQRQEAKINSQKGNEIKTNERKSNSLKERKDNALENSTNEHIKGTSAKSTDGGEMKKSEAKVNKQAGEIDSKRGKFNNRKGKFNNREGKFNNRQGKFNNRQGKFNNRQGKFNNRQGKFNNRQENFNNRQGKLNNQEGKFYDKQGKFKQGNFNKGPRKNRGKPVEPAFANSILRRAMLPVISDTTQPQYIFHKFAEMSAEKSSIMENESNSNLTSSVGKGKNKAKTKKTKLTISSQLEANVSETVGSNATSEEIVSFKKANEFSVKIKTTKGGGPSAPGLFFRKSKKLMAFRGKSVEAEKPRVSDTSSKVVAEDIHHKLPSNEQNTTLTSEDAKRAVNTASQKHAVAVGRSNEGKRKKLKSGKHISLLEIMSENADHGLSSNDQNIALAKEDSKKDVNSASQKRKVAAGSANKGKRKKIEKSENFSFSEVITDDADHGLPSTDLNTVFTSEDSTRDVKSASPKSKDAVGSSNKSKRKRLKKGKTFSLLEVTAEDADRGLPSNDHNTALTSENSKSDANSASQKRKVAVGSSNEGKCKKLKGENFSSSEEMVEDANHALPSNDQNTVLTSEDNKSYVKSAYGESKDVVGNSSEVKRKKGKKFSSVGDSVRNSQNMDEIEVPSLKFTSKTNYTNDNKNRTKSTKEVYIFDDESLTHDGYGQENRDQDDLGKRKKVVLKRSSSGKKYGVSFNLEEGDKTFEHKESELDSHKESSFSEHERSVDSAMQNISKRKKREKVKPVSNHTDHELSYQGGDEMGNCTDGNTVSFKKKSLKGILRNRGRNAGDRGKYGENMDFDSEEDSEREENNSDVEENAGDFKMVTSLFRNNPEIRSVGQRAVEPVKEKLFSKETFADLDIHKFQVSNLESLGLTRLTVVQRKSIPPLLEGRDALVRSQTGSGKTLAYALPIVEMLQRQQPPLTRADGIRALIILPTRELVQQTYDWFLKLRKPFLRLVPGMLLGGEKRKSEKARLRKGITILMGTPGRIRDHVQHTTNASLHHVQYLVLDEADCMLDMGYERDIAGILRLLKKHSKSDAPDVLWKGIRKQSLGETAIIQKGVEKSSSASKSSHTVFNSDDEQQNNPEGRSREGEVNANEKQDKSGKVIKEEEDSDYDPEVLAEEGLPVLENEENNKKSTRGRDETDSSEESDASTEESEEDDDNDADDENEKSPASKKVRRGALRMLEAEEEEAKEPGHWQSILLSATLTPAVERLAGLVLRSPIFVDAADVEADSTDVVIPHTLDQSFIVVPAKLRLVVLSAFIGWKCKFTDKRKILLFCATQDMVNYLTELLTIGLGKSDDDLEEPEDVEDSTLHLDIEFFRLHGNMEQRERTHVFQTFRAAKSGVLLCTDVAARGLDLPRVDWIVQFTAPGSVADYVHRVGRTARVGAKGNAVLFLLPSEVEMVEILQDRRIRLQEQDLQECLQKLLLLTRYQHCNKYYKTKEDAAASLQLMFENSVVQRRSLRDFAVKAFQSYVRFYASYPREMRDVLCFKALHVGHAAKSFALRDPPSKISAIGRRRAQIEVNKEPQRRLNHKLELYGSDEEVQRRGQSKRPKGWSSRRAGDVKGNDNFFGRSQRAYNKNLVLSEFASGMDSKRKT